jgi:hypothetical protein
MLKVIRLTVHHTVFGNNAIQHNKQDVIVVEIVVDCIKYHIKQV